MTPGEVIERFGGTQVSAAREIGCNQSTISDWVKAGFVPSDWQHYIASLSDGDLLVDSIEIVRRVEAHISRRQTKADV